jgi:AraC family transcriptional regulator of adaptative response / methylphosphotriester-DNA alkyltransferase methyltransferase
MTLSATRTVSARQKEIVHQYEAELDKHMLELKAGGVEIMHEISDFAKMLNIHPIHLSNTVKAVTGRSSCDLFEERLVTLSKEMLANTHRSVADIARQLTYDPSNFTKFFKKFVKMTPKAYRDSL